MARQIGRYSGIIGMGLLAGLVATLTMILLMVSMRYWLGISPPPEALPDRFAPEISIKQFFDLFDRFGGYNGLKKFGIKSGLTGLVATGALVGIAYSLIVESRRSRSTSPWRWGISRLGASFVGLAALVLWIASVILYWPVLATNFKGLPPSRARLATAAGLLIAYLVYSLVLIVTYRFIAHRRPQSDTVAPVDELHVAATSSLLPRKGEGLGMRAVPPTVAQGTPIPRRAILSAGVGGVLALPSYSLMKRLYDDATFTYDGRAYSGPGVQPITPNDKFYSVTKNVVDPDVSKRVWRLEIGGLVEDPKRYDFDDLVSLPATNQETTLMCISNRTGAGLFSNAVWTGIPMRDLLNASGVKAGAVEVLLRAADGYTDTFSIEQALDPITMVVYQMNGEPLPRKHGYPVRVISPGLFGEKNVKWVTGIEVIDHDGKGFYEKQGWGPTFITPTRSDIFGPRWTRGSKGDNFNESLPLNRVTTIKGRAFAGSRGISKVEFSSDAGETWQPARIDYPGTRLTWTFWSFDWRPTQPGDYTLLSRSTDGNGAPQIAETRGIAPQGATGYHRVKAKVV